jgi:hypothetical protein
MRLSVLTGRSRRFASFALAACALASFAAASRGCGGSSGGGSADGGSPDGGGDQDSALDAGDILDAGPVASDLDGWVPWNDYDPSCSFYVPASKANNPPPIGWEPCPVGLVPAGVDCREMTENWGPNALLSPGAAAYVSSAGTVVLALKRFYGSAVNPTAHNVVVDADGPVHLALLETGGTCGVSGTYAQDGRVVYRIADSELNGQLGKSAGGAVGGAIDAPPRVLLHFHDAIRRDYPVGANSFLEFSAGATRVHTWSDPMGATTAIPDNPADNGAAPGGYGYVGDTVFWNTNAGTYFSENAWTSAGGTKPVLGFGADLTRGAYDFGTDGKDMAWHEGTGLTSVTKSAAHVDIMTAPYATSAASVVKRRLRSEYVSGNYGNPFTVGCGYAASGIASDADGRVGLRIIRLLDGVSWTLVLPGTSAFQWQEPLAITCKEIFVSVTVPAKQVVRLRLDSLVNPEQPN